VRRLALTLAALLPSWRAAALDKPLGQCTVEVWRAKDGLPSDWVRGLAQTPDRRLWAATLGGVVRFDGQKWSAPEVPAPARSMLSDLAGLHAGSDGVWLLPTHRDPLRLGRDGLRAFAAADGWTGEPRAWAESGRQVWTASTTGLHRYADGRFVPLPIGGLATPTALDVDAAGTLWVGTNRGLFTWRGGALAPVPGLAEPVAALHRDRAGTLWAAAGARLVALPAGKSWGAAEGLPAGAIAALADDRDGNLWIGTSQGLLRLRDGRFSIFTTRDGLPDDDVTSLLVDREETLWVGTRRGGVAQFTDRTLETLPALDGVVLDSVCEAEDGAMWFGTRHRGAARWKDGRLTFFGAREGLPADAAYAVLPDGGDAVWIGTVRGLARYHDGRIQPAPQWPRFVTGLYRDRGGALWIAGNGELGRLAGGLNVFRPEQGLPATQLRAVAEDARGTLWVSAVGGLVRLENERFVPARLAPALSGVRSMLASRDGSFWLTTVGNGLARVAGGDVRLFAGDRGLDPDRLSQLLEDDAEDLWLGVHNKIVRVDRASLDAVAQGRRASVQTVAFESTDRRAGVVTERVRQPSAWKGRDGRLWFITDQGAVVIDPHAVRANGVAPVVEIESATMDGRAGALDQEARFPAGPGRLVLQYGAISLLQPGRVRYRHRLEGVDRDWVEAGPARAATYAGLRPGSYRFAVQASNNDGVWNERGASLAFVLAAPFYRSTWFFATCGLAGLALTIAGYRVRVARLRAQYVLLFAERTRMARELHDTLLQGLSATALQLSGMRAEGRDLPESTQKDLALMQETISRCLQETRQAVWGLRERGSGGPEELSASLERMVQRLCGPRGVAGRFRRQGTPARLAHPVEDELFRIAQEAVSNALQHARARTVEVLLCYDAGTVTLTISDDGAGFDPGAPAPQGHFGLTGMRERATRIGARLDIASGSGTTVTVRVDRS
jgi:signal transduction histidine kinase/ligand-binding sensor domain-containing protein